MSDNFTDTSHALRMALDLPCELSFCLYWDYTEGARIVDVIIGGRFRPTRSTWQKLIDAGLPMCSWQEASESWDLEASK